MFGRQADATRWQAAYSTTQSPIPVRLTVNRSDCRVDADSTCGEVVDSVRAFARIAAHCTVNQKPEHARINADKENTYSVGVMEQPVLSNLTVQRRDIDSGDAITADEAISDAGSARIELPEVASIPVADTNIRYARLFWTLQDEIHHEQPVSVPDAGALNLTAVCWYRRLKDGVSDAGVLDVFGLDLGADRPLRHVLEGSEISQSLAGGSEDAGRRFHTEPVGVTVRALPKLTALRFDHWHVIGDEEGLRVSDLTLDVEPGVSALAVAVYRATGTGAALPRREFALGGNQDNSPHHGLGAWIAGRLRGSRRAFGKAE